MFDVGLSEAVDGPVPDILQVGLRLLVLVVVVAHALDECDCCFKCWIAALLLWRTLFMLRSV